MSHIYWELHEIPRPSDSYINHSDGRVFLMAEDGLGKKKRKVIGRATSESTMHPNDLFRYLYPALWSEYYGDRDLPEHELHAGMYALSLGIGHSVNLYPILQDVYGPLYSNAIMDYAMYSIMDRTDTTQLFPDRMAREVLFSKEAYSDSWYSELFSTYIRRRGTLEPLPARFCNGTTVTCSGLSQWGSQALAQQGLNSVEILRTYYGDDIELVVGAPVLPLVRSYPGTPLNRGDRSGYVQLLQQMLNRISLNYPSIPQLNPDGIYGALTEQAVRQFQDIFGLEPDGVVGQATWYAVVRLYVAVTRLTELYTEGINLESLSFDFFAPLSLGEYGPKVQQARYMLAVLGQFIEEVPPIEVSTVYDQDTVQAVEAFQRYDGLP